MSYASVFTAFKRLFELKRLSSSDDWSDKDKNVFFVKRAKYLLRLCFYCFQQTL